MLTENNANLENAAIDNDDPTKAMKVIDNTITKSKFKAFGKVKVSNKTKVNKELEKLLNEKCEIIKENKCDLDDQLEKVDNLMAKALLSEQRENVEKEMQELKSLKYKKGKSASIFAIKNKVVGPKKIEQEATIIKNPKDNQELTEPAEIRKASLAYCKDLLTNRLPKVKFQTDVQLKIDVHGIRMKESVENDIVFSKELFQKSFSALKKKNSHKYDFILKAGQSLHLALYHLFENVWNSESEPDQWRNTNIIQLYKGKGSKDDISNYRNIHTKLETPKFFGHIVVSEIKDKIMKNMTRFQLGTKPGHRAQEHLFVMRSVMALYELCGLALILQLFDISKFFDREMLLDCMDTLYNNGIRGKLYRLIYEMNRETRIRVRTDVGTTSVEHAQPLQESNTLGHDLQSC